jgi:hypothetical protein
VRRAAILADPAALQGNRTNADGIQGEAKAPLPSFRRKPESRFVGHELGPGLRRDDDVCTKSCFAITM